MKSAITIYRVILSASEYGTEALSCWYNTLETAEKWKTDNLEFYPETEIEEDTLYIEETL